MEDLIVYEIRISYDGRAGQLPINASITECVQGKTQRDQVIEWLKDKGFEPTWSIYAGKKPEEAIRGFVAGLNQFPVVATA